MAKNKLQNSTGNTQLLWPQVRSDGQLWWEKRKPRRKICSYSHSFPYFLLFLPSFIWKGVGIAECCLPWGHPQWWYCWPEGSSTWTRPKDNKWGFYGWEEGERSITWTSDNVMGISEGETGMIVRRPGIFKHITYKLRKAFLSLLTIFLELCFQMGGYIFPFLLCLSRLFFS